ncbi:MAG: QueT transporter family protein [Lachnospiraceae bacterium]|nr:QueT transporter family protein [Lachnospiraceae bacterium]
MRAKIIQMIVIAALYTLVTVAENYFFGGDITSGITKGIIQSRLAEALTVLPVFTPAAIPGLFIGCLLTNLIIGCHKWDIIFGSLATLVAAIVTYLVRKHKFLAPIPPIVINMMAVPLLFTYVYRYDDRPFWQYVIFIGAGELIACGIFGIALMLVLDDHKDKLFPTDGTGDKTVPEKSEDGTENKEGQGEK